MEWKKLILSGIITTLFSIISYFVIGIFTFIDQFLPYPATRTKFISIDLVGYSISKDIYSMIIFFIGNIIVGIILYFF